MGSVGGSDYTYLHFNSGQKDTEDNAYYLCAGRDSTNTGKNFSSFEFTLNNYIITNISVL